MMQNFGALLTNKDQVFKKNIKGLNVFLIECMNDESVVSPRPT